MTDEADESAPEIAYPIPQDYDEEQAEAFLRGIVAACQLFGHAAQMHQQAAARMLDGSDSNPPAEAVSSEEAEAECRTCGGPLTKALGSPDSEHSPQHKICTRCEFDA